MSAGSEQTDLFRVSIDAHRAELAEILDRYSASNPRLFGSVARGDAHPGSDIDVMVDLDPEAGNPLLRIAGIGEEFGRVLGVRVDVVADALLRDLVSEAAHREAVAL